MAERLLSLRDLHAPGPGGKALFKGLDLEVPLHSRWLLLGRSGSGKSTLLRMAAGLEELPPGATAEREGVRGLRAGFAFRDGGLLSALSLEENLTLPLRYAGRGVEGVLEPVAEPLGLMDWLDTRPHGLSPTLRRLANLARVVLQDPELAFFDDPLGDLDPQTHGRALGVLQTFLEARPRTVLIAATEPTPYEALRGLQRALLSGGRLKRVEESL